MFRTRVQHDHRGRLTSALAGSLLLALLAGCGGGDPAPAAELALGREVFTSLSQPTCATCHTLQDAGAAGTIGPNLDALKPDSQRVAAAILNGVGIMPPQKDVLTAEQIGAVARYVSQVAQAQ